MKYKKFLIIPFLIFFYIFFVVDFLVNYNPILPTQTTTTLSPTGGQQIGVSETISVVVTRPYFFGLFRLPVYTNYIGYIGDYHEVFFSFIGILFVAFIIMEWRKIGLKIRRREGKMAKKSRGLSLAKAIGLGVAFSFVVYILSGDAGVSIGLGLLIMYLENKLK